MIERSVLWEHAGGGSILFWVNHRGELGWVAHPLDDGLRLVAEHYQLPNLEVYRTSGDGEHVYQAPSNPHYGRKYAPDMRELIELRNRREGIERVKRFGELLRKTEVRA